MVTVSVVEPERAREASAISVSHAVTFLVMVQEFTLVALHEMVVAAPLATRSGAAPIETVGIRTVTVAIFEFAEPSGPVQET